MFILNLYCLPSVADRHVRLNGAPVTGLSCCTADRMSLRDGRVAVHHKALAMCGHVVLLSRAAGCVLSAGCGGCCTEFGISCGCVYRVLVVQLGVHC